MRNKYLFSFLMLFISSCSVNRIIKLETPFVTVVKLHDAEQALHLEEARQYIDVEQVYRRLGSKNPEKDWEEKVKLLYGFGKTKKFTNTFGYGNYNIIEMTKGSKANVCFQPKVQGANRKMIIYGLEKRQKKWIIVSIDTY